MVIVPIIGKRNGDVTPMDSPALAVTSANSPPEDNKLNPALNETFLPKPWDLLDR